MSTFREQGVVFECQDNRLVGVATLPDEPAETGVLILVAGPSTGWAATASSPCWPGVSVKRHSGVPLRLYRHG